MNSLSSPSLYMASPEITSLLMEKTTLAVEMGEFTQTSLNFMEFLVVDSRSAYHGVLGKPALKDLGAVTLIHHLYMKFPTKQGIATVRKNQRGAHECYLNSIRK